MASGRVLSRPAWTCAAARDQEKVRYRVLITGRMSIAMLGDFASGRTASLLAHEGAFIAGMRAHAIYCCRVCVGRAQHQLWIRFSGTGARCGTGFVSHKPDQVYCPQSCRTRAM